MKVNEKLSILVLPKSARKSKMVRYPPNLNIYEAVHSPLAEVHDCPC